MSAGRGILLFVRNIAATTTSIATPILSDYTPIGSDFCITAPITLSATVTASVPPNPSVGQVFLTVSHGIDEPFSFGPLTPTLGIASITIDNPSLYFVDGYGSSYSITATYTGAGRYISSGPSGTLNIIPRLWDTEIAFTATPTDICSPCSVEVSPNFAVSITSTGNPDGYISGIVSLTAQYHSINDGYALVVGGPTSISGSLPFSFTFTDITGDNFDAFNALPDYSVLAIGAHFTSNGEGCHFDGYGATITQMLACECGSSPSISAITLPFGTVSGGTNITLTGSSFTGTTSVSIGGVNITSLVVVDDNTITGTTATGSVANVDVVATNGIGSGTLSAGFTYLPTTWTLGLWGNAGVSTTGDAVATWADQSPSGNDFTAPFTGPTYVSGSSSYLAFDGSTNSLLSSNPLTDFITSDGSTYAIYVVALTNSANSSTNPEGFDAFLSDHDPAHANWGYLTVGPSTGFTSLTNSITSNIYTGIDSTVGAGNSSIDFTNIQLSVFSLSTAAGGTQSAAVNSGGTFSNSTTGVGTIATSWQTNQAQIGTTDFGAGTFLDANLYAFFCFSAALSTDDDVVVRTMFKNLYSIPNW